MLAMVLLPVVAFPAWVPAAPPVTDVAVEEVRSAGSRASFELAWENAFRDERNHDAVWLTLKTRDGGEPVRLAPSGHAVVGEPPAEVRVSADGLGAFVQLAARHRGDVAWRVELATRTPLSATPEVWAVEVVYVPAGPYELGDADPLARELGSFHALDEAGGAAGPFRVRDEGALEVGADGGGPTYLAGQYTGDGGGPLPAAFPKGTRAFYLMKFELRQGEYARFLNALPAAWQERRRPDRLPEGTEERETGSIAFVDGRFRAAAPRRPCNFVTWDDTCAYLDFLGLRPFTELEFEKAARGPRQPGPLDFPWGTNSTEELRRGATALRDLTAGSAADEAGREAAARARSGASYYGVMDLAGSLWERVVSAGSPEGRGFRGTHGDGLLEPESGDATNADWPRGTRTAPGLGFRGGAEYFGEPSLTNPFSPVGVRTYAAYDGAHRYKTYSARGARTAP